MVEPPNSKWPFSLPTADPAPAGGVADASHQQRPHLHLDHIAKVFRVQHGILPSGSVHRLDIFRSTAAAPSAAPQAEKTSPPVAVINIAVAVVMAGRQPEDQTESAGIALCQQSVPQQLLQGVAATFDLKAALRRNGIRGQQSVAGG